MKNLRLDLDEKERDLVVRALRVLRDEYQGIADKLTNRTLVDGYDEDIHAINQINGRLAGLEATPTHGEVERQIVYVLKNRRNFIEAIKRYRELTGFSLKDAKTAVENIGLRYGLLEQFGPGIRVKGEPNV